MTATTVNGVTVVSDEPTPAPMKPHGKSVYWEQTRTLTLADGRTVYGCQHCRFVRENPHAIRPHLRVHKPAHARRNGHQSDEVRSVMAQLTELDQIRADRDEWKRRAQAAERDLRTIRRAIGGTA